MAKRKLIIGEYDTALHGWTLCSWSFNPAEPVTSYIEVPGRVDGPLDGSTILTDGDIRYGNREFHAVLECSEGTRLARKAVIAEMVNSLDGRRLNIVLPDDPTRYIVGRVHVTVDYNDLAHASVQVTAVCEPWLYNQDETVVELIATAETQTATLINTGRRVAVPTLTIESGDVHLRFGGSSWVLSAGVYVLPDLCLVQGESAIEYSGAGSITITYREAAVI